MRWLITKLVHKYGDHDLILVNKFEHYTVYYYDVKWLWFYRLRARVVEHENRT